MYNMSVLSGQLFTSDNRKNCWEKRGNGKGTLQRMRTERGGVRKKREANLVLHLTIAYCTFEEKPFYYMCYCVRS